MGGAHRRERLSVEEFQSAVAHELISNAATLELVRRDIAGFKALSRMSSFPTTAGAIVRLSIGRVSKRCRA